MAKARGFRESMSHFGEISKEISEGRFAPLYLLMGEEGFFIDQLSNRLSNSILDESERAFNQLVVYGKDSSSADVINFCKQMPMMGRYQVVIVKEAQQLTAIDKLSIYTKSPAATTILILCHKEKMLDKRTVLYKQIAQKGVVFESIRPRDYEIGEWLAGFIRSKGYSIEPKALTMLTDHLGMDVSKISNEIDKLMLYLPKDVKTITADHIEENVGISKDFNNFELTKAISERDMKRALLIADHFARDPKRYPVFITVSMMFYHFQRIFILNYQNWLARKNKTQPPNDTELTTMLNLSSTFFLREYRQAAMNYPNKDVFIILGVLREYDLKVKGLNSGGADNGELLRELLLKIFMDRR